MLHSERQTTEEHPYQVEVLDKFREDDVGIICRTDDLIICVGNKFWAKSIKRKRKSIMGDMRKIGTPVRRVVVAETVTATDLFDHQRFDDLARSPQTDGSQGS